MMRGFSTVQNANEQELGTTKLADSASGGGSDGGGGNSNSDSSSGNGVVSDRCVACDGITQFSSTNESARFFPAAMDFCNR